MRKTKTKRKISKFTNKNRLGGGGESSMKLVTINETGQDHPFRLLGNIARSLMDETQNMEIIKSNIILMITKFKVLSIQDKIAFVQLVSSYFNDYHPRNPILIELYYMQIMILIDATLHISWRKPSTALLAKLSNDTMQMIAKKFERNVETPVESLSSGIPVQRLQPASSMSIVQVL